MNIINNEKRTWLTLLTNDGYLYGVVGLYFSLQEVGTKYPFHCIVTTNLSDETISFLHKIGVQTIMVEPGYVSPSAYEQQVGSGKFKYQSVVSFHTKMKMYSFTQFDKIVYLDGDMLVFQNIDELFEKPHLSHCLDNWNYFRDPNGSYHLNGGLLVFEPNKMPQKELAEYIQNNQDWTFGDESVLMNFFQLWNRRDLWLDPMYDTWWDKIDEWYRTDWWFNPDNIKIIHYVCGDKPWQSNINWLMNAEDSNWSWWFYFARKNIVFLNQVISYLEMKGITHPALRKLE